MTSLGSGTVCGIGSGPVSSGSTTKPSGLYCADASGSGLMPSASVAERAKDCSSSLASATSPTNS